MKALNILLVSCTSYFLFGLDNLLEALINLKSIEIHAISGSLAITLKNQNNALIKWEYGFQRTGSIILTW